MQGFSRIWSLTYSLIYLTRYLKRIDDDTIIVRRSCGRDARSKSSANGLSSDTIVPQWGTIFGTKLSDYSPISARMSQGELLRKPIQRQTLKVANSPS
jgi:hypothetical protein